ncbi:MAG TPA: ACT domain-containing protein [Chloroflexia bacterium]|nr:ACT domain-containing protein [Chloroflexia bacterium]
MSKVSVKFSVLAEALAVCRLEAGAEVPGWAMRGPFFSVTRTAEELSIVCSAAEVPQSIKSEVGWKALKLEGPFDFGLVGILASITEPLAQAGISLFALSTFDTDYVLVKEIHLSQALAVLQDYGHQLVEND